MVGTNPTLRALAILLVCTSTAFAQSISFPTEGQFRPGEYIPLVIEADAPGVVSIRAPESLGIDWESPGKTSVTVPWMTWRQSSGAVEIEVNGRSQTVMLQRLGTGETYATPNPYEMPDNLAGPRISQMGDAAYLPSYAWPGGLSARTRWLIVAAAGVVALVLAAIKLTFWRSRVTPWVMIIAGIGASVSIAFIPALNQPVSRATAIIELPPPVLQSDRWVYLRSARPVRTQEPWSAYTYLFPRSTRHLESLDPVAHIRPDGLAGTIHINLAPNATACLLQRVVGVHPPHTGDTLEPRLLVDRFYQ